MASLDSSALKLSAQRALLGAIPASVRLIKIMEIDGRIVLTVISAQALSDQEMDALTTAAAEIIADFPDCSLEEDYRVSAAPLPRENRLSEGWVFARMEP